jgi:prepilin-type N-terminal cleavage/methylation domain-containing protein
MRLRSADCGVRIEEGVPPSVPPGGTAGGISIRNPKSKIRNPRRSEGGFTLVEVMIALAIIGITAVVLLDQRLQVVRDAGRARDLRTAWILAAQKMAELELDPTLWTGASTQSNGDFSEVNPDYNTIYWDYQIVREPIDLSDPNDPKSEKKPRELLRLTLVVRAPGLDEPIVLEGQFPIRDPKTEAAATPAPGEGQPQPPSGTPPQPGTPKK